MWYNLEEVLIVDTLAQELVLEFVLKSQEKSDQ